MKKYKTKNMNLQLFAGEITDLTGTSWVFTGGLSFNFYDTFDINGSYFFDGYEIENFSSMSFVAGEQGEFPPSFKLDTQFIYIAGWNGPLPFTLNVLGGTDVTNQDLISWLQTYATQVQSGYSSTITLTNCTCNKSDETGLSGSYNAIITTNSGYYLSSVTSTLGTATISTDKHTAIIQITDVTEDFTITSVGTAILYKNVELSPNANGVIDYTTVLLPKAMSDSSKQNALTTAQMTAVNSGITSTLVGQIGTNQSNISGIQELIPSQATNENQLADKEFVNSSIATNTANFIGTFANITALNNYVGTVTNNDYANVVNQELDFATTTEMNNYTKALLTNYDYAWVVNGTKYDLYRFDIETQTWGIRTTSISKGDVTLINAYNRYTYNGNLSQWAWNYTINTSGFTAQQWAAINSGATAEQIQALADLLAGNGTKTINNTSIIGTGNIDTSELFECTYGTTTYAEITNALSAGKIPYVMYNNRKYMYQTTRNDDVYFFECCYGSSLQFFTIYITTANAWSTSNRTAENITNKVTSLSLSSTDTQYPSAKLLYDQLALKQNNITTANINDGTLDKLIGFNSSGNLVKETSTYIRNNEVIDRRTSLPLPSKTSADFIQYENQLLWKKPLGVIPGNNLTDSMWVLNNDIDASAVNDMTFSINFTCDLGDYTSISFSGWGSDLFVSSIKYDNDSVYTNNWTNQSYRYITITGGTDVTNSTLRDWLQANGSLIYDYKPIDEVSVSDTGTATDEVNYITINGTEKKLAGGTSVTFVRWS